MKSKAQYIYNLKEEKKILKRSLNLYYFNRKKRDLLFTRLEKVNKEIERVENNADIENRNPDRTQK